MSRAIRCLILVTLVCIGFGAMTSHAWSDSGQSTVTLHFLKIDVDRNHGPPSVQLDGAIVPESLARPASIFVNDDFVGHAIFGAISVDPEFRLPAGSYDFRVRCPGYEDFESDLTVLGNDSKQCLVVTMRKTTAPSPQSETKAQVGDVEAGMKASELEHRRRTQQKPKPPSTEPIPRQELRPERSLDERP